MWRRNIWPGLVLMTCCLHLAFCNALRYSTSFNTGSFGGNNTKCWHDRDESVLPMYPISLLSSQLFANGCTSGAEESWVDRLLFTKRRPPVGLQFMISFDLVLINKSWHTISWGWSPSTGHRFFLQVMLLLCHSQLQILKYTGLNPWHLKC